jgi:hypothetical protein
MMILYRKALALLATMLMLIMQISCVPKVVMVDGLEINQTELSLTVGGEARLVASILPANASNQHITWTTSYPSIVVAGSNGMLTAKSAGTATITATAADGGKQASCIVHVEPVGQAEVIGPYVVSEVTITLPFAVAGDANVVGGYFVAVVRTAGSKWRQIIAQPLDGSPATVLYESQSPYIGRMRINEDWLVVREEGFGSADNRIVAIDRRSGQEVVLDQSDASNLHSPTMLGDWVTWVDSGSSAIVLVNLREGSKLHIATLNSHEMFNNWPVLSDEYLFWTDHIDGNGYYKMYNLHTGKELSFKAPSPFPGYAKATRGRIYAIERDDPYVWSEGRLWFFDIHTRTSARITQWYINSLRARGDIMAYIDDKDQLRVYAGDNEIILENPGRRYASIEFSDDGRLCAVHGDPNPLRTSETISIFTFTPEGN